MQHTTPTAAGESAPRLLTLDALRGLLMVLMALDHASLFVAGVHPSPEIWSAPLPRYSGALPFLTRLVTHLAAPGFAFLLGASLALFADARGRRGWSRATIARYLALRGLLLLALQLLVENPAWQLGQPFRALPIYLGVLYALGGATIAGAALVWLPALAQLALGLAAIGLTLAAVPPGLDPVALSLARALLLTPGQAGPLLVRYPLLPWLGVACLGMAFGRWRLRDRAWAYRGAGLIGAVMLILFVAVRLIGGFGNIRLLETPDWIGFLNVVKYPPSLPFLLLTLGLNLLLLALFSRVAERSWVRPLLVLGRRPLFFYVAHLYLYGLLGLLLAPDGVGLLRMYPVWLAGLAVLLLLCRWFGAWQRRRPPESLWRLI